jgi:Holin of 3TMs, for gene-transfer release
MADEKVELSASEQKKEDWMNSKWRPAMGWVYMLTCTADFVIFPILWSVLQSISHGQVTSQWQPLTLQGAGLYHIAMGAVLGLAAFGRTQEKIAGANNGGLSTPASFGTTYQPSQPTNQPSTSNTSTPASTGFGTAAANTGFGSNFSVPSNTASTAATVLTGFGGKPAPVQPAFPII